MLQLATFSTLLVSALALSPSGRAPALLGPSNAICTRASYNITPPAYTVVPFASTISAYPNQTTVTSLQQQYVSSSANFTAMYNNATDGASVMEGSYEISGVLCVPVEGDRHEGTVQLLVHGIGFDSSYWDFPYEPETYSYVQAAAAAGYTTFRYDRLGTGYSQYPADGYRTVQGDTDLAILNQFTSLLRSGAVGCKEFSKIVAIGHSYGSVQTMALVSRHPTAVDAVALTGFSAYGGYIPMYLASGTWSTASSVFPYSFSELPGGYLVMGLPQASQLNYYYWPYYDQNVFNLARATEQPVTQGVLMTVSTLAGPAPNFTGPVHLVSGAQDWPFCGGNCYAEPSPPGNLTILELTASELFPYSNQVSMYVPANTGHNLNLHLSAPETFRELLEWIDSIVV